MTPFGRPPSDIDWNALDRLRRSYLAGDAGEHNSWRSEEDLAAYDATFAQRIGWKWDFVLEDLGRMGWTPPVGEWLDWGCGSGIAMRAFLDHFGEQTATAARFFDHSPLAMQFAADRCRARFPGVEVRIGGVHEGSARGVLVSHVLTELTPSQIAGLETILAGATSILWVEPGTRGASLALVGVRERLRGRFEIVAPCVHPGRCGLLAPGCESHWCHHFATPAPEVFTDPFWARFAKALGIDLRSVPLSYLVLDARPSPPLPADTWRMLGRPEVGKVAVRVIGCDAAGVAQRTRSRRDDPELWRQARKKGLSSLQVGSWEGHRGQVR